MHMYSTCACFVYLLGFFSIIVSISDSLSKVEREFIFPGEFVNVCYLLSTGLLCSAHTQVGVDHFSVILDVFDENILVSVQRFYIN